MKVEVAPAILHATYEALEQDWNAIQALVSHIQIDITDGIFAGDPSFKDIQRLKQLVNSQKADLHLMVHTPGQYVDDIINLNPARCVFHVEAFAGAENLKNVYEKLRASTQTELGLALNPDSPLDWLEEHLSLVNFILFMGYNPGRANQPINPAVYTKLAAFRSTHPGVRLAVDGHVDRETVTDYVKHGATILYANTSIFGTGNPQESLRQLQLLAESATTE